MTIAEVAKRYGLTPDTLRYYERVGLLPPVGRTKGGVRDYQEEDCQWIEFIKCMRASGLPVEVLAEYVALFQQGDSTMEARKQLLVRQRNVLKERVAEMQQTLERLERKIQQYEEQIFPIEHELKENNRRTF